MEKVKLTQYSKGSGCGCKIAPAVLQEMIKEDRQYKHFEQLIVGNEHNEDAAVYDLGNNTYLISSTDFFTPIVDDPYTFGKIAATNAISDVYAMGGKPIMATGILGWPIEKLEASIAANVIIGAKEICYNAGIPLAGGHSIDSPEPFFGLSVNGLVSSGYLKRNSTLNNGDLLYITKEIGTGILSAALKRGKLLPEHEGVAEEIMFRSNKLGETLSTLPYVTALTDITGFGLLGHLYEMLIAKDLYVELHYEKLPIINNLMPYTSTMCIPDNTYRNWNAYEKYVEGINATSLMTLCDPQTSGGLLIGVDAKNQKEFEQFLQKEGYEDFAKPVGIVSHKRGEKLISITYESKA